MTDKLPATVDPASTRMFQEAADAANMVQRQFIENGPRAAELGAALRALSPRAVVTCARGSSDHAATFAKYLIEMRLGVITASAAPSMSSVFGVQLDLRGSLFLTISQSGRSPDLVSAAKAAKAAGATVVALVNVDNTPLADEADYVLPLHAGPEASVAATKSYIASLAAIIHLVAAWSGDESLLQELAGAPDKLKLAWQLDWTPALPILQGANHLFVIARGLGLGIAQEAALKCKETCALHAEAFSGAEVQHGPQALLQTNFPALIFTQNDESQTGLETLAGDLAKRSVDVLFAGKRVDGTIQLPTLDAHPAIQPILIVQSFYKLANALALSRGMNPDQPPHLRKVTETN